MMQVDIYLVERDVFLSVDDLGKVMDFLFILLSGKWQNSF